ncbi:ATP-binding protein [Cryobacterium sp. CG_9.6]|uniref:ATP-binding protein n=1 Tax=Cryobacterium sp. CG_9.6 TaxID=2760710 RepID=UPI0032AFC427
MTERDNLRFETLLEAARDAIVCVDARGLIITANAQVTALFGYERHELLGSPVEILLPESSRHRHTGLRATYMHEATARPMGLGQSLFGHRRNGSLFPISTSMAPTGSGPEAMVIVLVRDLTAQRELERESAEHETELRQLAESVDIGFILYQLQPPTCLYVSPAVRSILGVDSEDPVTGWAPWQEDSRDLPEVEQEFRRTMLSGLPAESEHRIVTEDGQARWVRWVARPVPSLNGPTERSVVTVENTTVRMEVAEALQAAEAAARTANEAKNQFLSRVSHELRTPLNAVLGFSQLLRMQLDDTDYAESIDHIQQGGRHLLNLINDVLDISRIEAGNTSISWEPVPVTSVMNEARALMEPLAQSAGITLIGLPGRDEGWVLADKQRLRQVLLNLLSNAVKYNRVGGTVWVEHLLNESDVAIMVRDNGPAIAPELQSRLFTPFDRLGAESRGIEGTGIGLALTRALVELMGGSLGVDSVPGRGSLFTVTLPRTEEPNLNISDERLVSLMERDVEVPLGSCTLLYIEDNESNVHLVEQVLKLRPAWRLLTAGNGQLGIDLARLHQPNLVLLDLHLPDISGADVLRNLTTTPDTAELPVVILTADISAITSRQLLAGGAEQCMTKPLDVEEVLALLDQTSAPRKGPA